MTFFGVGTSATLTTVESSESKTELSSKELVLRLAGTIMSSNAKLVGDYIASHPTLKMSLDQPITMGNGSSEQFTLLDVATERYKSAGRRYTDKVSATEVIATLLDQGATDPDNTCLQLAVKDENVDLLLFLVKSQRALISVGKINDVFKFEPNGKFTPPQLDVLAKLFLSGFDIFSLYDNLYERLLPQKSELTKAICDYCEKLSEGEITPHGLHDIKFSIGKTISLLGLEEDTPNNQHTASKFFYHQRYFSRPSTQNSRSCIHKLWKACQTYVEYHKRGDKNAQTQKSPAQFKEECVSITITRFFPQFSFRDLPNEHSLRVNSNSINATIEGRDEELFFCLPHYLSHESLFVEGNVLDVVIVYNGDIAQASLCHSLYVKSFNTAPNNDRDIQTSVGIGMNLSQG